MCTNIAGLRNNFVELKYVVKKRQPKIIFLNETHVSESCDINDLKLRGYYSIHCESHSKHTGGVSAYISNDLKVKNVKQIKQLIAWYISFVIVVNKIPIVFAGVYLSAKSEHKQLTIDSFEQWYEQNLSDNSVIIMGDFNIDFLSVTTYSRRLREICDDNGLKCSINSATRITKDSATLIDLCLTNLNERKLESHVIIDDKISDHLIIESVLNGNCDKYIPKPRLVNTWYKYDVQKLWQSLENSVHTWQVFEYCNLNIKMNWLLNIISNATKQFKRVKTITTNDDFFDNNLDLMRIEKNRLYKIAQYCDNDSDRNQMWHDYKLYKNSYKNQICIRTFENNQNKLNRVQGDMKGTWKVLNSILNKENNDITIIKVNDREIENDLEIANEFNKYFIDSIVDLNDKVPKIQYENDIHLINRPVFEFRGVSISEIKICLKELKNNTDEFFIRPSVLSDAVFILGPQIVNIINQSFESGIFPEALKKSTIIPIQKKCGSIDISNHRPINMLPCIERLIESLAYKQLNAYVTTNNLLASHQSGFRRMHSCESAINDVLYEWREAQNNSKIIIAVFLDFQRAFETIESKLAIDKLEKYGISGTTLNWFKSYLNGRKQTVKIGESISQTVDNNLGVPQGSILGPLIFILYVNNMVNCLKFSKAKMFADDTLIYIVADSLHDAMSKINSDLDTLFMKLCQNKLKLNVDKTKAMVITNKLININDLKIFINGSKLDIVNEIKYLGVILDNKLKFDSNVSQICKKIGQKLNVLNRLRHELNQNQKLYLYKTIIQPHFMYCPSIIFLANESEISRLQVLQNKCMRQILKADRFTSGDDMLKLLKLMNVNQLITFRTLIFIFNIIHGLAPQYLSDRILYNQNLIRQLRNKNQILLTNATKTCSQNALFYKGIQLFNSLPEYIKSENSKPKFQKLLSKYIFETM